jgi:hypothetical protein
VLMWFTVRQPWISLSLVRLFTAVPAAFEKEICETYFGHKRYSSFLRELSNHGFKHISQGSDRNCYYHEFMLRGLPHLCKYMPKSKDARRLIADPENEPNFYVVTKNFPLPDDPAFGHDVAETELEAKQHSLAKRRLYADKMDPYAMVPVKRYALDPSYHFGPSATRLTTSLSASTGYTNPVPLPSTAPYAGFDTDYTDAKNAMLNAAFFQAQTYSLAAEGRIVPGCCDPAAALAALIGSDKTLDNKPDLS